MEQYLLEKRDELIWALEHQGYNHTQIAKMFNLHKVNIGRIIKSKPNDYRVKWIKQR